MIFNRLSTKFKDHKKNIEANLHCFIFKQIKSWDVIHWKRKYKKICNNLRKV